MQNQKKVQKCAEALKSAFPGSFRPALGVILGTGMSDLADSLSGAVRIPYSELPDFPKSTVPSHRGFFVAGYAGHSEAGTETPVIVQQGRSHLYEGHSPADVCIGVRAMALCGIKALIVTNAAGAINPRYAVGGLMLLEDHINCAWVSPLAGPNVDSWGPRFPDMSRPYDPELSLVVEDTALRLGIRLEKGVYAWVPGPQLETRAETRFLRLAGADAVGMSTVLEVIAARHMGVRVVGISTLSNLNLPDSMAGHTIDQIIEAAEKAGKILGPLLWAAMPELRKTCG